MKKIVIILTIFLISLNSFANVKQNVKDTRSNLGTSLNKTVKELRRQIKPVDTDVKNANTDIKRLLDTATKLKNRSTAGEINPTVLDHGKSTIDKCESYEELIWTGASFDCRPVKAEIDCEMGPGEYKTKSNVCYQPESYNLKDLSWGPCQDVRSSGERHTELNCSFVNTKDKSITYQVENEKCSSKPLYSNVCGKYGVKGSCSQVEQACGQYGANSSCKCPVGTDYYYKANSKKAGKCVYTPICEEGFIFTDGACISNVGGYANSAKSAGGSSSYSKYFPKPVNRFKIKVWTEDLYYSVAYRTSRGTVYSRSGGNWKYDKDDYINYGYENYTSSAPGTLSVYVREGGSSGSGSLGYKVDLVGDEPTCGELKGAVYDAILKKCVTSTPICSLK